jgi:hypothetical protein
VCNDLVFACVRSPSTIGWGASIAATADTLQNTVSKRDSYVRDERLFEFCDAHFSDQLFEFELWKILREAVFESLQWAYIEGWEIRKRSASQTWYLATMLTMRLWQRNRR